MYFDSFVIEYIPQEVLNRIKGKSITHNTFRMQSDNSIVCEFYCMAFIEYMISGKTLLHCKNLFFLIFLIFLILKTNVAKENVSFDIRHKK